MKKKLSVLVVIVMVLTLVTACGGGTNTNSDTNNSSSGNNSSMDEDMNADSDFDNNSNADNGAGNMQDSPTCVVVSVASSPDEEDTREDVFSTDDRVVKSYTTDELSQYFKSYEVTMANWQDYFTVDVTYDENMDYHAYLSVKNGGFFKSDGVFMELTYDLKEITYAYWDETLEQVQSTWSESSYVNMSYGDSSVLIVDHMGSEPKDFVRIENFKCINMDRPSIEIMKLEIPDDVWTEYNGKKVLFVRDGTDMEYAVVYEYENNTYELSQLISTMSFE